MLEFRAVEKAFRLPGGGRRRILSGLTLDLPQKYRVAIIGRNGAGKSTFLRMVAGTLQPDHGEIRRLGRISWPMGFSGGFHPALTGRQNARFVARIYGVDTDDLVEEVQAFCDLGPYFDARLQTYSSGMKARLALGVSLATNFDCYLVDEITAVGDAAFRKKAQRTFAERLDRVQVIMVSHSEATLREYCNSALFLQDGEGWFFEDLEEGLAAYRKSIAS
ncbi:ABC transporter ATP-binding protein [Rhodovulum sulfidophilum]|uniref:ABC transporter ATP-binding protein n=1 Tax=Rhodovulum sulfidophilum TaxID=35806 RepID=UPI001F404CCD|nr:ABC transporter ATP-binding protein [Rhodovulum sulfidophilum]MCE8440754.1 ABC transporter ATP-binding protein [Rhodovulum sulfidophilum]MCE8468668.1 ABC transporter ATP-binding protein [Rhodovulum sulfidophilum]